MESEAFISSENSCISTARRTRAGWLARAGFYDFDSPSIATTALYSRQLALSEPEARVGPEWCGMKLRYMNTWVKYLLAIRKHAEKARLLA